MESLRLNLERENNSVIPYEYNYFIGISLYKKLMAFQKDNFQLHNKNQIDLYTFSNIISKNYKIGDNGIDIKDGFIIFRTINDKISPYLRYEMSADPYIKIKDVAYNVRSIKNIKTSVLPNKVTFKTISPVIIRNYSNKKLYIDRNEEVEENLNKITNYQLNNYFGIKQEISIKLKNIKEKTIRISSNGLKESITRGFNLSGIIEGDASAINFLYYKGLGSKTSLGLGCWEVIQ